MITISKPGWMANFIGYAQVVQIAKEGRMSAEMRPGRAERVYTPVMGTGEKLVDYFLCGGAKLEFMKNLYLMSQERTWWENSVKGYVPSYQERLDSYWSTMTEYEAPVTRLLAGNSLKFDTRLLQGHRHPETFLIYRDFARRTAIGLAIQLQPPSLPAVPLGRPIPVVHQFEAVEQIQLHHLPNIKKLGRLTFGDQTYVVRFSEHGEPVVMQENEDPQAVRIQKRLHNLCSISASKDRLVAFRRRSLTISKLNVEYIDRYQEENSPRNLAERADWNQLVSRVQGRLQAGIDNLNARLNAESRRIETELEKFARLINPTRSDSEAYIILRKKIAVLEHLKNEKAEMIETIHADLSRCCDHFSTRGIAETREFLKDRLLKFADQTRQFLSSSMDQNETTKFKKLLSVQSEFFRNADSNKLRDLLDPLSIQMWEYPEINPPDFREQHKGWFAMMTDPFCPWSQFAASMERIEIEQENLIQLKIRQIKFGYKLSSYLDPTLDDWQRFRYPADKEQFSDEYMEVVARMRQLKDVILHTRRIYTQSQLDELIQIGNKYIERFVVEWEK